MSYGEFSSIGIPNQNKLIPNPDYFKLTYHHHSWSAYSFREGFQIFGQCVGVEHLFGKGLSNNAENRFRIYC